VRCQQPPTTTTTGKTTFLNDTAKSHHSCTYIRQYHNLRPYIAVTKIPNFYPSRLPYWNVYVQEATAATVGGTMAGQFTGMYAPSLLHQYSSRPNAVGNFSIRVLTSFLLLPPMLTHTAGLSGGQRKLLLFELICQRTTNHSNLLLVFDEPFAGVTDDFVPFIVQRLNALRSKHNVLLVTNDHVDTIKALADNTIVVSAIDRSTLQVNDMTTVSREKTILALSVGDHFVPKGSSADLKFFLDVEVVNNGALFNVAAFSAFACGMFLITFWDSGRNAAALVIVAVSIIGVMNPYFSHLAHWRNFTSEEAEALLHSSKSMNKALKCILTLIIIVIGSLVEWGVVNAVTDGFEQFQFW
jgi:hypothetical protein